MATNNIINSIGMIPCFSVYLNVSTGAVTGGGSFYELICDSIFVDNTSSYDNTTGRFTIPETGNWHFSYNVTYHYVLGSGATHIYTNMAKITLSNTGQTTLPTAGQLVGFLGPSDNYTFSTSVDWPCTTGNAISVGIVGSAGLLVDSIVGKDSSAYYYTSFHGYLVR